MSDTIRIRKAPGTWVVRAGGAIIGESRDTLELDEVGIFPIMYFPREHIAMDFFDRTGQTAEHPEMGTATLYTLVTGSSVLQNAAYSYEAPKPGFEAIAGRMAFHASDQLTVERI